MKPEDICKARAAAYIILNFLRDNEEEFEGPTKALKNATNRFVDNCSDEIDKIDPRLSENRFCF